MQWQHSTNIIKVHINPDHELTGSVFAVGLFLYVLSFTTGTLNAHLMYYLLLCCHCVHLQAGCLAWVTDKPLQVQGKVYNNLFMIYLENWSVRNWLLWQVAIVKENASKPCLTRDILNECLSLSFPPPHSFDTHKLQGPSISFLPAHRKKGGHQILTPTTSCTQQNSDTYSELLKLQQLYIQNHWCPPTAVDRQVR